MHLRHNFDLRKSIAYHMTYIIPATRALKLVPLPSQSVFRVKFLGMSTPSWSSNPGAPMTCSTPVSPIRQRITSLKSPNAFCRRSPHFRNMPCMTRQNVRQMNARNRVMNIVGSLQRACIISDQKSGRAQHHKEAVYIH